jgi:hypothetical protein
MLSFPRLPLLGLLLVHPVLGLLLSLILAAVTGSANNFNDDFARYHFHS